ncbi:MAG: transglutaminase family protein [Ideonella sp.]
MKIDSELVYEVDGLTDFIFLVHARHDDNQCVTDEQLLIDPPHAQRIHVQPESGNRQLRIQAQSGRLTLRYQATVDKRISPIDTQAGQSPIHELPDEVLHFVMPTRYCESDHLGAAAQQLFVNLEPGYARVQAITEWVRTNITYRIGSSTALTTARDVFVQRAGVCRDLAHLSVSFCRALNIPARLVAGYSRFPEPPPDFHALFEAYIGGRWVMFDPTGMVDPAHVVTIATGGDAKDVAFATIFGPARMLSMRPDVEVLDDGGVTCLG